MADGHVPHAGERAAAANGEARVVRLVLVDGVDDLVASAHELAGAVGWPLGQHEQSVAEFHAVRVRVGLGIVQLEPVAEHVEVAVGQLEGMRPDYGLPEPPVLRAGRPGALGNPVLRPEAAYVETVPTPARPEVAGLLVLTFPPSLNGEEPGPAGPVLRNQFALRLVVALHQELLHGSVARSLLQIQEPDRRMAGSRTPPSADRRRRLASHTWLPRTCPHERAPSTGFSPPSSVEARGDRATPSRAPRGSGSGAPTGRYRTPRPGGRLRIRAAAYLHDLGYAPALVQTGPHPLDGARHLRALGLERLAGLVAYTPAPVPKPSCVGSPPSWPSRRVLAALSLHEQVALRVARVWPDATRAGFYDHLEQRRGRYGLERFCPICLDVPAELLEYYEARVGQGACYRPHRPHPRPMSRQPNPQNSIVAMTASAMRTA